MLICCYYTIALSTALSAYMLCGKTASRVQQLGGHHNVSVLRGVGSW